jgi:type I site-specific restriction endonuclease
VQISTKDLQYLTDEMSWELLAMKKCHHAAREVQDPAIATLINQVGQMHQRHYETLLVQLQMATGAGTPMPATAQMPQMTQ